MLSCHVSFQESVGAGYKITYFTFKPLQSITVGHIHFFVVVVSFSSDSLKVYSCDQWMLA